MERMTPDTDKREGLGEGIYAKFVQNYEKLLEENKKLKFDIEARKEMKKAREEKIRFLEECLDNKEKVNKSLREELDKIKSTYVYDAKQVRDIC